MSDFDKVDGPALPMLLARHRGCGKVIAVYWETAPISNGGGGFRGAWRSSNTRRGVCDCVPRPARPDDAALEKWLRKARSRGIRADGKAQLTVTFE